MKAIKSVQEWKGKKLRLCAYATYTIDKKNINLNKMFFFSNEVKSGISKKLSVWKKD